MNNGVKTIIYPLKDINESKTVFRKLLSVEPYADQPYYVGFKVGDQDIGLVPNNPEAGMTAFYHVDDIKNSLQILLDGGWHHHPGRKKCWSRKVNSQRKR